MDWLLLGLLWQLSSRPQYWMPHMSTCPLLSAVKAAKLTASDRDCLGAFGRSTRTAESGEAAHNAKSREREEVTALLRFLNIPVRRQANLLKRIAEAEKHKV